MARKGRPRRPGRRHRSGKLKRAYDRGAERVQAARDALSSGKAPELSTYPLGIMFACGDISDAQREAGCRYAGLYCRKYGKVSVSALAFEHSQGHKELIPTKLDEIKQRELERAQQALEDEARGLRDIIDDIAVYERKPGWQTPKIPTVNAIMHGEKVKLGVRVLAQLFGLEK